MFEKLFDRQPEENTPPAKQKKEQLPRPGSRFQKHDEVEVRVGKKKWKRGIVACLPMMAPQQNGVWLYEIRIVGNNNHITICHKVAERDLRSVRELADQDTIKSVVRLASSS